MCTIPECDCTPHPVPEDQRALTMTPAECREYHKRYLHAAQDVRRKYGRRAAFRRQWLEGAWLFRKATA